MSEKVWYMTGTILWYPPDNEQVVYGPLKKDADRFKNLMVAYKQCVSCGRHLLEHQQRTNADGEVMCEKCHEYYSKRYVSKW
jgi:formylmethanofuran dehydrogenase subunit E